jgi:hypothetical protein
MVVLLFELHRESVTCKKYLPKSQGFCRIKKTEFSILDKVELKKKSNLANEKLTLVSGKPHLLDLLLSSFASCVKKNYRAEILDV